MLLFPLSGAPLTLRFIFEQLMLCIYYFWIGYLFFNYVINIIHCYLTNKLLYLIYSELF